ncbi:MAG TPA: class I fructose-bisphosphate aldolase [Usitatibacter sp.]|jgi:fructose-bisphosphate aldolase class I|nr:class I fructose-bisphosphate aldolase [Usitatibacter sp.]
MDTKLMTETARAMVAPGKGLLAADESAGTCKKRFDTVNVECNEENRRAYREMLFTTPNLAEFVSGVILFDETIRQKTKDGVNFAEYLRKNGIIPGIKVDAGAHDMALHPNEKVTEGLDRLDERMKQYFKEGARFAKWRAVITIGDGIPTQACLDANAHALARYSAICQANSIVPIVEPEVLLDGDHSAQTSEEVHERTLETLFHELWKQDVSLEHVILKASMCVSGKDNPKQAGVQEVAERTLRVLKRTVPAALPGVVFLSGGQSDENATAHLDAMNRMGPHPWPLTFSYSRALQAVALKAWRGQASNAVAAQKAFQHRARMNSLAAKGQWNGGMEKQAA